MEPVERPGGEAPTVSIVMPAYNAADYIAAALESIVSQSFPDWELAIFDDGSSDATADIARRHAAGDARIRVIAGVNGGVAEARNRGLQHTDPRSRFVIFLDNDDTWEPELLTTLVTALDAHPDWSSAHALPRCIDESGRQITGDDITEIMRHRRGVRERRVVTIPVGDPTTFSDLAVHNWVTTPGTHLVRRDVVERVGGFDKTTTPADDWDFAVRVSRFGPIGLIDRALINWRRHPGAQSFASPRYRHAHLRVRRKMLSDPTNTPEQRSTARLAYRDMVTSQFVAGLGAARGRDLRAALGSVARGARDAVPYIADVVRSLRARR